MNKLILLAAVSLLGFASCTKKATNNGPYTCICHYNITVGTYYKADTSSSTPYASGVNLTQAQNYCSAAQSNLQATGNVTGATCLVQ